MYKLGKKDFNYCLFVDDVEGHYLLSVLHNDSSIIERANHKAILNRLQGRDGWHKFYLYGLGEIELIVAEPDRDDLARLIDEWYSQSDGILDEGLYESLVEDEVAYLMEHGYSYDEALNRALEG